MTTLVSSARAALPVLVALVCFTSTAFAAGGGPYDTDFGTVALPTIPGANQYPVTQCEALNDHAIALSAQVGGSLRAWWEHREVTAVLVAKPDDVKLRRWKFVKSGVGEVLLASDFSPTGIFAYVHGQRTDRKARTFVVRKAGPDGKNAPGWHNPTLKLPPPAKAPSSKSVSVLNLADGGVLVSINRFDGLRIFRFSKSGKPAEFGTKGVVVAAATEASSAAPFLFRPTTPLLETRDGSLLVAASGRPGEPRVSAAIGLLKLDSHGAVVDGFADHGYWSPPVASARTIGVVGEQSIGMPLTVLSESFDAANGLRVTASQLSATGVQTAASVTFESGMNGLSLSLTGPFDFERTTNGFVYAAGRGFLESKGLGSTLGRIVGLDPLLAQRPSESGIAAKGRLLPYDFAATPDGKFVYGCGGYRPKRVKHGTPGTTFAPALNRFKL